MRRGKRVGRQGSRGDKSSGEGYESWVELLFCGRRKIKEISVNNGMIKGGWMRYSRVAISMTKGG